MREDTKAANNAVRVLTADEVLAVSGGKLHPIQQGGLGGLRRALGGGILGEIASEIVHTGRRVARELPFPIF